MGNIYDKDGKKVGSRQGNEIYVDDKLVGRIQGDTLVDTNGHTVGQMKNDQVLDSNGKEVFEIESQSILDKYSGNVDAKVDDKESVPAAAFYSLLKKNKS